MRVGTAGLVAAAALVAAATASAAPPAAGPVLDLPGARGQGVEAVAVTDAGDALLVLGTFRGGGFGNSVLAVRQRRGARGPVGPPVRFAGAAPAAGVVEAALGRSGDAYVAVAGATGVRVHVRRGWAGRWRVVTPPGGAGAEAQTPRLTLSRAGLVADLLWVEDRTPGPGSGAKVLHGARLTGGRWTPSPDVVLSADADIALAAGGAAVAAGVTGDDRILVTTRATAGAAWAPPVELSRVGPLPGPGPRGLQVHAAAGRDGSLVATWTGVPPGGSGLHAFVARRATGAAAWGAPLDLGAADAAPVADANAAGGLAVAWPQAPGLSDEGSGPLLLRVAPPGGALAPALTVPVPGAGPVRLGDDGTVVTALFGGLNTASSNATLLYQARPGAPPRRARTLLGDSRAFAAGKGSALLAAGSPAQLLRAVHVGVNRLGPLGLRAPAGARPGRPVVVRLELWRRTRVTLRVMGGPSRFVMRATLPPGRSAVRLPLPARAGAYLIRATGREQGGRAGLRQEAVVRAR